MILSLGVQKFLSLPNPQVLYNFRLAHQTLKRMFHAESLNTHDLRDFNGIFLEEDRVIDFIRI